MNGDYKRSLTKKLLNYPSTITGEVHKFFQILGILCCMFLRKAFHTAVEINIITLIFSLQISDFDEHSILQEKEVGCTW